MAYCRYADDFVVVVKGTRAHAQEVREACRAFLEGELKLTLNMAKAHITHVNAGFVLLGPTGSFASGDRAAACGPSRRSRGRSTEVLRGSLYKNCLARQRQQD